jgi:hypothetical protein
LVPAEMPGKMPSQPELLVPAEMLGTLLRRPELFSKAPGTMPRLPEL